MLWLNVMETDKMAWYAIVREASIFLSFSFFFISNEGMRKIYHMELLDLDHHRTKLLRDFISLLSWRTCSLKIRLAPMQKRWILSISSLSHTLSRPLSLSSSFFPPSGQRFKISDPRRSNCMAKQLQEKRKAPTPTGSPVLIKTPLAGCISQ